MRCGSAAEPHHDTLPGAIPRLLDRLEGNGDAPSGPAPAGVAPRLSMPVRLRSLVGAAPADELVAVPVDEQEVLTAVHRLAQADVPKVLHRSGH